MNSVINLIKRLQELYITEGPTILLEKILGNILYYPAVVLFILINRYEETDEDAILLRLRQSTIDADRLSLIKSFSDEHTEAKIYLIVWSKYKLEANKTSYLENIETEDIEIIRVHSIPFVIALAKSSIVNFCHEDDFALYRRFDSCEEKTYIRTYHGIKVKGNKSSSPNSSLSFVPEPRVDLRPVSSDLELYARAALEKREVADYDKCGYPRFDRIYKLKHGETNPILPEATYRTLESSSEYKVLYAPTQGTNTKLYNLPDLTLERLEDFLITNDIELYLRMHTNEEGSLKNDILELTNVHYAGRSFTGSSIEILPYMDALITDFSSIYMEFLPFNRPIIFIEDDHFVKRRGITYDYKTYYPGRKVDSYIELESQLKTCVEDNESYASDRKFVRKTFNIDSNTPISFN